MLITLSRRAVICQSVVEVWLTGVAPLGTVSHRFNLIFLIYIDDCEAKHCLFKGGIWQLYFQASPSSHSIGYVSSWRPFIKTLTSSTGLVGCWNVFSVAQAELLTVGVHITGQQELTKPIEWVTVKPENKGFNFDSNFPSAIQTWYLTTNTLLLLLLLLLLLSVHPLPNAKDAYPLLYLLPGFCFSWSS